jgi:homoserine kinase
MSIHELIIKAPATTANLGPGFDVFGMAFEYPTDKVKISLISKGIKIKISGIASNSIPTAPQENTAGVVAKTILENFSINTGLMINLEKGIKPGIGLGSSAASAAAVAYGLNFMFNLQLDQNQLIQFSAKGEIASAGFEHADNVSAAIFGDFIIIKSYQPLEVINLKAPINLSVCIAIPEVQFSPKKTEKARSVLPKKVLMKKIIHNIGNASCLAVGFVTGDVDLIGRSMSDAIVEPARAFMIPGYEQVKNYAIQAGASGVAISGAGPAMMAIVDKKKVDALKVAVAMEEGFESVGVKAKAFSTKPGKGITIKKVKK